MNLGAMVDLGVDQKYLVQELSRLHLSGYKIEFSREKKKGIEGTRTHVILDDRHQHGHNHGHDHATHENRNFEDIKTIIDSSHLSDPVKTLSKKMFLRIAEAEAMVHGTTIDRIHFHEVGAVDSIVDIVGAAICFEKLKVDKVVCTPIELGGGFVQCRHGIIPVPAPATVEILKGIPVKTGGVQFETTTPTGAAILATIVDEYIVQGDFVFEKTGYGIGYRDLDIPNVLRVSLCCDSSPIKDLQPRKAVVIECNLDDMNPEHYDFVFERLFDAGADDVFLTQTLMKKSRPGVLISVVCPLDIEEKVIQTLLMETTTLGVRKYTVDKLAIKRDFIKVSTKFGDITLKTGHLDGKCIKAKPEYEECKKCALMHNVPIQRVVEEVLKQFNPEDR